MAETASQKLPNLSWRGLKVVKHYAWDITTQTQREAHSKILMKGFSVKPMKILLANYAPFQASAFQNWAFLTEVLSLRGERNHCL